MAPPGMENSVYEEIFRRHMDIKETRDEFHKAKTATTKLENKQSTISFLMKHSSSMRNISHIC